MRVFGKSIGDYVRFAAWVVALVAVVGFARLASSLAGLPVSSVRLLSVTTTALLGIVSPVAGQP